MARAMLLNIVVNERVTERSENRMLTTFIQRLDRGATSRTTGWFFG